MNQLEELEKIHGSKLIEVESRSDIPKKLALVYTLFYGNQAIVTGEGKDNRARVITGGLCENPPVHKKAMKVRLYRLYGDESMVFRAFVIKCSSKQEAREIEKELHLKIGGNSSEIATEILDQLFDPLEEGSLESIFLWQALCSSYDGIYDLRKWRREGIITDDVWEFICERLKLNYMMPKL